MREHRLEQPSGTADAVNCANAEDTEFVNSLHASKQAEERRLREALEQARDGYQKADEYNRSSARHQYLAALKKFSDFVMMR